MKLTDLHFQHSFTKSDDSPGKKEPGTSSPEKKSGDYSRKGIFMKSFPLILSELGESVVLLTGVVFMAFEGEAHLAAIGMIDAFLLLCLVYGFALNDGFQNYYARQAARGREERMGIMLKLSISRFGFRMGLLALTGAIISSGIYYLFPNPVFFDFILALPLIVLLVFIYSIGLAFHAYLAGKGHLVLVGILALVGIAMNALFLFGLLYLQEWPHSPTIAVVLAAILSEAGWVLSLVYFSWKFGAFKNISLLRHEKKIAGIIARSAVLPGISNAGFQFSALAFFIYFSDCCEQSEVASLSILFSFWTVLMSPVNGICETAINGFSGLHAHGLYRQAKTLKWKIFQVSIAVSAVVGTCLLLGRDYLPEKVLADGPLLIIFGLVALLAIRNKIGFVAMIVKLKIAKFFRLKVLYVLIAAACFLTFAALFGTGAIVVLISMLVAQAVVAGRMVY